MINRNLPEKAESDAKKNNISWTKFRKKNYLMTTKYFPFWSVGNRDEKGWSRSESALTVAEDDRKSRNLIIRANVPRPRTRIIFYF